MEKNFLVKVINKACCGDCQMKKRMLNLLGIDLHKVHYETFNDKYSKKYRAHDENNKAKPGDIVRIVETRPISKTKRFNLVEIVEEAVIL